jgi:hypothetical protein
MYSLSKYLSKRVQEIYIHVQLTGLLTIFSFRNIYMLVRAADLFHLSHVAVFSMPTLPCAISQKIASISELLPVQLMQHM